jgi:hypothetical protein
LSGNKRTDGVTYGKGVTDTPITYAYNLSGALVERQYPSGHVVKNVLNNDGTFEIVESKKNANYGYWTYAISFIYTAAGAVSPMQLGRVFLLAYQGLRPIVVIY